MALFSTKCSICGSKEHSTKNCPHALTAKEMSKKSGSGPGSSSKDASLTRILAWLIGAAIVVFIAVWLAVNVVLPVILLNLALIMTVLGIIFNRRRKLFAGLGIVGGLYMILDVLNGWFSSNLIENVLKNPHWITAFVYLNALSIGLSTWILVQPFWANASQMKELKKGSRFISLTLLSLLISGMSLLTPILYHFVDNEFFVRTLTSSQSLKRYEGTYFVPADELVDEGELTFKVDSSRLIGICEQRVNPMGGLAKRKYEITEINSKGEGTFNYSNKIFDRWGKLLGEKTSESPGKIYFLGKQVKIGDEYFEKIVHVFDNYVVDQSHILSESESSQINSLIREKTQEHKIGLFIYSVDSLGRMSIEKLAKQIIERDHITGSNLFVLIKPKTSFEKGQAYITFSGTIGNAVSIPYYKIINHMVVYFRKNDYYGGLLCGIDELYKRLK